MAAIVDEEKAQELLPFLTQEPRGDLKFYALQYVVGLTGSDSGKQFLKNHEEFLKQLFELTRDSNTKISLDAFTAIVNLSAEPTIADKLMKYDIVEPLVNYTLDSRSEHANKSAVILSNLTRTESGSEHVMKVLYSKCDFYKIVEVFCKRNYNPNAMLDYLAPFLSNLTQLKQGREFMLDRTRCVIQRLLPFTQHHDSTIRRGGVVTILKNCCFETEAHEWLLSEDVDILPHLLLPLAGPEEIEEEDMEKLPPDLQYLDDSKKREEDPDIRKLLLEVLLQLMASKHGRKTMKDKNVYVILRELHNWEQDEEAKNTCLKCIEVLIADEPQPGMENLREVVIPDDIKFEDS